MIKFTIILWINSLLMVLCSITTHHLSAQQYINTFTIGQIVKQLLSLDTADYRSSYTTWRLCEAHPGNAIALSRMRNTTSYKPAL